MISKEMTNCKEMHLMYHFLFSKRTESVICDPLTKNTKIDVLFEMADDSQSTTFGVTATI